MIPQFSDFEASGETAIEEWAAALVETAKRYEAALQEIASRDAGADWFMEGVLDIARSALADAGPGEASENRDRVMIYPAGRPTSVTCLWMSEARVVAGGETFSVEFPMPDALSPTSVAFVLVATDDVAPGGPSATLVMGEP